MWQTVGHIKQKQLLDRALETGSFSHAYLFSGPSHIGKKTLALEFAQKILGLDSLAHFHPDLTIIDNPDIKISDVRTLVSDLSLKPHSLQYKIAILNNFDSATTEAANSILKTLEEPTDSTILILIATSPTQILPTLVSRCQVIHLSALNQENADMTSEDMQKFGGKIGLARLYSSDSEFRERYEQYVSEWNTISRSSRINRLAQIKHFSETKPEEMEMLFAVWIHCARKDMAINPRAYSFVSELVEAYNRLEKNFNKKLVFEKLFLNLG